ncbi:hypothetical protein T05_14554 [Trichinella murrelli]|uniref:Uncharacterized protein n=1 Tax=Trichinella murrelli TaxID=144512 RepID=A0A0V0TWP5_9BILA|nr:hypothetical protein T05_14554 [Trichinella murrelli]
MSWCSQDTGKARTVRPHGLVDCHLGVLRPGSGSEEAPCGAQDQPLFAGQWLLAQTMPAAIDR